jgi:hypothetical protein
VKQELDLIAHFVFGITAKDFYHGLLLHEAFGIKADIMLISPQCRCDFGGLKRLDYACVLTAASHFRK